MAIKIECNEKEWWFENGKLHRPFKPAVIAKYTQLYFWKGIEVTERMMSGKMTVEEILNIPNMEQRQATMDIVGYERFLDKAKKIHSFTPDCFKKKFRDTDMYVLYEIISKRNEEGEDIKILMMCDPSKVPLIRYFIRVPPTENTCAEAVAHSYGFDTWNEFIKNKVWV